MPEERVFSEQEVGQIIRRAVEISEEGTGNIYTPGVTRSELEKIAAEVGVPSDALARAIEEAGQKKGRRSGFKLVEEFERVVEGELRLEDFDVLAEGLTPVGNIGQPTMAQFGRTASMNVWAATGSAKIDVTSRNGRTRLKVRTNAFFQGLMTLYPGTIAAIIAIAMNADKGQAGLGLAIALPILMFAIFLFGFLTQKGQQRAEKMADDLRERIAQAVPKPAVEAQAVEETPETVEQRLGQG